MKVRRFVNLLSIGKPVTSFITISVVLQNLYSYFPSLNLFKEKSLVCTKKFCGYFHLVVTLRQQAGVPVIPQMWNRKRIALYTEDIDEVSARRNSQCWMQTCLHLMLAFPMPDSLVLCFSYLHVTTTLTDVDVNCHMFSGSGLSGLLQPGND